MYFRIDNLVSRSGISILQFIELQIFKGTTQLSGLQARTFASQSYGSDFTTSRLYDGMYNCNDGGQSGYFITYVANANPWLYVDLTNLDFDRIVMHTCSNIWTVGARVSIATTSISDVNTILWTSTVVAADINTFNVPGIYVC